MTDTPRLITDFSEIKARPDFDALAPCTLDNFASIVTGYRFSHNVICQVHKVEGRCGHQHLEGWLGKTKNGKEVLIGSHCGPKYFGASNDSKLGRDGCSAKDPSEYVTASMSTVTVPFNSTRSREPCAVNS